MGAVFAEPQPQPVPPADLTAASRAQHPLSPAGAGPPQHPLADSLTSGDVRVDLVFDMIGSSASGASIRAVTTEDANLLRWTQASPLNSTRTALGHSRSCSLSMAFAAHPGTRLPQVEVGDAAAHVDRDGAATRQHLSQLFTTALDA